MGVLPTFTLLILRNMYIRWASLMTRDAHVHCNGKPITCWCNCADVELKEPSRESSTSNKRKIVCESSNSPKEAFIIRKVASISGCRGFHSYPLQSSLGHFINCSNEFIGGMRIRTVHLQMYNWSRRSPIMVGLLFIGKSIKRFEVHYSCRQLTREHRCYFITSKSKPWLVTMLHWHAEFCPSCCLQ